MLVPSTILALPVVVLVAGAEVSRPLGTGSGTDLGSLVGGYGLPWMRSATAAVTASVMTVILAFMSAWFIARPDFTPVRASLFTRLLLLVTPLAILPLLVGQASFAFLFQDFGRGLVAATGSDDRGTHSIVLVEAVAQTIRYAPLLLWLMALGVMQVSVSRRRYAQQAGFGNADYIRTELMGPWLAPALVVMAFAYQDSANDHLVSSLSVRPSVATGTELVSHALSRNFTVLLSMRPIMAAVYEIILAGALAGAGFAAIFAVVAAATGSAASLLRSHHLDGPLRPPGSRPSSQAWPMFALPIAILAMMAMAAWALRPGEWGRLAALWPSAGASAVAAIGAWGIAALLIYRMRDRRLTSDGSAARALIATCFVAIAVGFIPALSLAVAVFGLSAAAGPVSDSMAPLALLLSETLRFTPIAFVLLAPAAFASSDREIAYLKSIGGSLDIRRSMAFLEPNRVLHASVVLICFNLVLNEGIIASVFQADVPSLTDIMRRAVTGRSANEQTAAAVIISQALLFGGLLLVWARTSVSGWRVRHAGD